MRPEWEESGVDERGQQTVAPRTGLPTRTPSDFAVVFWIAFAVSTLLVVGQIAFILSFTPVALRFAESNGATLGAGLELAQALGPVGLLLVFAIGDALIFALFAWVARRYWVGLLFVPSILYLAGAFGAMWVFASSIAFMPQ
jgi:hypothetical protein